MSTPTPADVAETTEVKGPAKLSGNFEPFVRPKRKSPDGPAQGLVRAWARENGIPCNDRGMVNKAVVEAYNAAQREQQVPAGTPFTVETLDGEVIGGGAADENGFLVPDKAPSTDVPDLSPGLTEGEALSHAEWADVEWSPAGVACVLTEDNDSEAHARSFNDGFAEAEKQLEQMIAVTERDRAVAESALAFTLQKLAETRASLAVAVAEMERRGAALRTEQGSVRLAFAMYDHADAEAVELRRQVTLRDARISVLEAEVVAQPAPWWRRVAS